MQIVKITNISHESSQGATSAWICSRNLSPGMSITVSVEQLPQDWERLGTIFRFEFLGNPETSRPVETPPVTQAPKELSLNLEMLEALMEKVVSKHAAEINKAAAAGSGGGVTKDELIDTLRQHIPVVNGIPMPAQAMPGFGGESGPSGAVFIPKIEDVEESSISIVSTSEKVDQKSLKDRLRKQLKPS